MKPRKYLKRIGIQGKGMLLSFILLLFLATLATACLTNPRPTKQPELERIDPKKMLEAEKQKEVPKLPPPPPPDPGPIVNGIMDSEKRFSLSFTQAPLNDVLKALLIDTELNLSLESEIDLKRPVTVHLKDVSFLQALDFIIAKGANYAWKLIEDCLYINRFEERIYHLDYLDIVKDTDIEVGGDMLSSSVENVGVIAKYQVKGKKAGENTDVWSRVEKALSEIKSEAGVLQINRSAGIIYMADTPRRLSTMVNFLDSITESLHRQIFIEAKIFEVQLSDEHKHGIDWTQLNVAFTSDSSSMPDIFNVYLNSGGSVLLADQSAIISALDFLQTQGDVTVLSNPHLSVMNGQSSVMTVGYQFPFGDIDGVDRDEYGNITYGASIKRAILGLQLGITPQISNNNRIILHVVPSITKIQGTEEVEIPISLSQKQTINNPIISLQELATTVRVESGHTVLLAGLISHSYSKTHQGVPWLGSIPFLGNLFKHIEDKKDNKELVILITPYIR